MEILIIFLLILLNGIFSMSEIALVSSRKFKLEGAIKKGSKNARKALDLAENPNTFLSTVQIGITLIGILTGLYSGEQITRDVEAFVGKAPVLAPYAHTIAVALVLIVLTFFSIVFGELIPKRIGLMFPESIATSVAQPMTLISKITSPFIWLLTKTNNLFLGIFGLKDRKEGNVSEEEIKAIVGESAQSGEIQEIEHDIVHRVFALGDRKVNELMTHRSDLIYFDITDDLDTIKQRAETEPHSVYPVVEKNFDKTLGIVSVKDIFPKNFANTKFSLTPFLKQPLLVLGKTPAYKVMEEFRQNKIHYAFVIDEYGMVEGLISMDDILDALIGDVSEYNHEEYQIIKREDDTWLADGQFPFFEFLNYFNLTTPVAAGNYKTLGGLIMDELKRHPAAGDKVKWQDFEFEVMDMDGLRIDKVLIKVMADKE